MLVLLEEPVKENARSCQDDLVSLNPVIPITGKGDIREVFILPHLAKRGANVSLEIIPFET